MVAAQGWDVPAPEVRHLRRKMMGWRRGDGNKEGRQLEEKRGHKEIRGEMREEKISRKEK